MLRSYPQFHLDTKHCLQSFIHFCMASRSSSSARVCNSSKLSMALLACWVFAFTVVPDFLQQWLDHGLCLCPRRNIIAKYHQRSFCCIHRLGIMYPDEAWRHPCQHCKVHGSGHLPSANHRSCLPRSLFVYNSCHRSSHYRCRCDLYVDLSFNKASGQPWRYPSCSNGSFQRHHFDDLDNLDSSERYNFEQFR